MLLGGEPEELEQLVAARVGGLAIEMVQAGDELEVFGGGEAVVERRSLRHVADTSLHVDRLLDDVEAGNPRATARRPDHAGEDLDGGGFAGAVGAQETQDLARLDAQVQTRERYLRAVLACQVVRLDHGTLRRSGRDLDVVERAALGAGRRHFHANLVAGREANAANGPSRGRVTIRAGRSELRVGHARCRLACRRRSARTARRHHFRRSTARRCRTLPRRLDGGAARCRIRRPHTWWPVQPMPSPRERRPCSSNARASSTRLRPGLGTGRPGR